MSAPTMAALLEALPYGRRIWITARGRSLWPLFRGGEQLQVERCTPGALSPGDVAVLSTPEHTLVAHVVTSTSPLRTAAFNGRADPDHWRPLGRVSAVKAYGRAVPLPRRAVRTGQRAWSALARSRPAQIAWRFFIATWASSGMKRVRALALGPIEVRLAKPSDRAAVVAALSMHEHLTEHALTQLLDGATVALATARGGAVGVAVQNAERCLTRARLLRRAARHGVEQRLVDTLLAAGLHEADVSGLKPVFVTALARRGFQPQAGHRRWVLAAPER